MADEVNNQTIFSIFAPGLEIPAFDSASTNYRNAQRQAYLGDADLLAVNELELIQARSRHMARNNAIASAAEDKFVVKLGAVTVKWKDSTGKKHDLMQELWDEFFANPSLDGKGDGKVMQATWNHDRIQSGEALARMVIQTKDNPNRVKLKIQNIESEYLDIKYTGDYNEQIQQNSNKQTRYGITFDGIKPRIYHFYRENYFGLQSTMQNTVKRIPVDAKDVIHIFERKRSNQWRGIPIIAPMLLNLYELSDLRAATVNKQQAAAAISWIIEQASTLDINVPGSAKYAGKTHVNDETKKIVFRSNGGNVQYTQPGDKFHLVQSSDIGNNYIDLDKSEMRTISSAYGLPYYMLSGDVDGLSFAAIRGILIELRNRLEYIHHFINIPDGLAKITKRFKAIAQLTYAVSDAIPSYQFPRYYGVDELKDTQKDILEVQAGFATSESKREERHTTYDEVLDGITTDTTLGRTGLLDIKVSSSSNTNTQANSNSSSN